MSRIPACLLALLSICLGASAAEPPKQYFSLHDLGHGVWSAIEMPGSHAGGNAGFVVGDDGVLVVDSFGIAEASQAFLQAIRGVTDKPIRYVVDTHYHLDHIAGNGIFQKAGAVIMAQRNVRVWSRTQEMRVMLPPVSTDEKAAMASVVPPELVYVDGAEVYLGEKKVILKVMPGHTGGDTVVVVPDAKVIFTGDIYWDHSLPNLRDANTRDQIATLQGLAHDYPDARFVPGHGKFVTGAELEQWDMARASDLEAMAGYLTALRTDIAAALKAGKSGQALQDEVLPKLKQVYGQWFAFDFFAGKNIAETEEELTGKKDLLQPVP